MATQRGRKSAAALTVVPNPDPSVLERSERAAPPRQLGGAEREVWRSVVGCLPADWFCGATLPILEQYCVHAVAARHLGGWIERARREPDVRIGDYDRLLRMRERETRAMASLATKLRITPQSTTNHRGHRTDGAARKPWEG